MKKLSLPEKIRIGFHEYKVIFPYAFQEDHNALGQNKLNHKEIRIADSYQSCPIPESGILQALMHEVFHGIDTDSYLKVFEDKNGEVNEDKLDGFAEWLCMVLRDNPEFTKLFLEGK